MVITFGISGLYNDTESLYNCGHLCFLLFRSFDMNHNYMLINEGPINVNVVVEINFKTRQIVRMWGEKMFYLPHGLSFDHEGNVWLTDVALHQIFKFNGNGSDKPLMTLGERFKKGNDNAHFCKPTSVAVSKTGDIYVADGYCNSRVISFDKNGKYLTSWGHADEISKHLIKSMID